MTREEFLKLSWAEQKQVDFRKLFDPETDTNLTANCIATNHYDPNASMVIYENAVYCFGCKIRWWPDQFLAELSYRPGLVLTTSRGAKQQPAPKYIAHAVPETFRKWLQPGGPYADRITWLLDRGLTPETISRNTIGHSGEAFTIPVYVTADNGGYTMVASIRFRRDDDVAAEDRPKYWGIGGANQAMLYVPLYAICDKTQYGVILCEGELDALRLVQEGYPAVSLTNGCNALKEEHLPKLLKMARKLGNRVTVAYDQDDPGRNAANRVGELICTVNREVTVRHMWWAQVLGKDVTELLQAERAPTFESMLKSLWRSS